MGSISHPQEVDSILTRLTLSEKVSLLAAKDWWRTPVVDRDEVFVPHIKSTDGPNGARGESYVSGIKAACFPCGTSLGASFDTRLLLSIGQEIAKEAITKSANILLAPTLNVIRSPLGGRNYETFSEDPLVLGKLAAAFIEGCQSQGIAATPKHFVANDAENQRKTLSVEVDEQTLREIYLLPFQLVLKYSDPWCFMTSYNKVNGKYVSDDARLVKDVLKNEWGFKGLVVSDWMGVYSTVYSMQAGVDLEMPGPPKFRGKLLVDAVETGRISETTIDDSASRVLKLAKLLGRFDLPLESPERAVEDTRRDQIIADAAADGMVLLKNDGLLPIPKTSSVAIIGHHATHASLGGGGSARVDALHEVTPLVGLKAAGYNVQLGQGVPVFGALPHADPDMVLDRNHQQSRNPVRVEWFNGSIIGKDRVHDETRPNAEYMIKEKWPGYLHKDYCTRMTFSLKPSSSGSHIFSIISTGRAVCHINGEIIFTREQETNLNPESFYFFKSKIEHRFAFTMTAGKVYDITLESWATPEAVIRAPPVNGRLFQGSALRFHEEVDIPGALTDAAKLASQSDVAIVCVGTTTEIESEGYDRDDMELPSSQYELIEAVVAANRKTCIINFSGAAVNLMPFVHKVPALVQAWFPGQECGHSLARILSGDINPSGRLPFSWPEKVEDNSSYGNFPAKENLLRYEEGLEVGYRWYDRPDAPKPLFPFGYGLSYTSFRVNHLECPLVMDGGMLEITCSIENTGRRAGKMVVQVYVQGPPTHFGRSRPVKELKDFFKVDLEPGERKKQVFTLDKYAVSVYDAENSCWVAGKGRYTVLVGTSVKAIEAEAIFDVPESFRWRGV